jgi:hypothetical protein
VTCDGVVADTASFNWARELPGGIWQLVAQFLLHDADAAVFVRWLTDRGVAHVTAQNVCRALEAKFSGILRSGENVSLGVQQKQLAFCRQMLTTTMSADTNGT